jgi:hypothetical protein
MVIKKVNLHALQNEEHAGFNTYLQEYINQYDAATLNVTDQAADHKAKLDDEKSVLDLVQKNTYSERLNTAEDARDYPIRGFFKVVKGMLHHFNPALEQAAANVDLINKNFSDITYLSNEKQTAASESYLAALQAAQADITTLGLADWVTEMKAKQANFELVVKSRNTEDDARPAFNMKAARIATDQSYKAIVDRINALITIDGDAKYAPFVTSLNNRIDQYNTSIAQRKGRNKPDTQA